MSSLISRRLFSAIPITSSHIRHSCILKRMRWQFKLLRSFPSGPLHGLLKLCNQPWSQFGSAQRLWTTEKAPKGAKEKFTHTQFSFFGIEWKVLCFFDKRFYNGCTAVRSEIIKQKEGSWRGSTASLLKTKREREMKGGTRVWKRSNAEIKKH